jgi:tetratricopeptide (TPR) repeat protein
MKKAQMIADRHRGVPVTEVDLGTILVGDWSVHPVRSPAIILIAAAAQASDDPDADRRAAIISVIKSGLSWLSQDERRHVERVGNNWKLAAALTYIAPGIDDTAMLDSAYRIQVPWENKAFWGVPVDRLLRRLALALARPDNAATHFENGLEFGRMSGYRTELAWTCFDYAEMLLDLANGASPREDDREKAIELQDEALAITQELGMRPLTERILARREILRV